MFGIDGSFILFQAFIICALLFLIARHEADYSFGTVVLVACGMIAGNLLIGLSFFKWLKLLVLIPIFFFSCWLIVKFCWVSWPKGILITALYFTLSIAFEVGKIMYKTGSFTIAALTTEKKDSKSAYAKDMDEGMDEAMKLTEDNARVAAIQHGEAPIPGEEKTKPAAPVPTAVATPSAPPAAAAPIPPPVSVVTPSSGVPPDWALAKSRLRIRGWMNDKKGGRSAMVNDQLVSIGDTVEIDLNGLRYTWRLAGLDGYNPRWEQVSAVDLPKK